MNNYESFKPIDGKVEKSGSTLFTRLFSKLNKNETSVKQVTSGKLSVKEEKANEEKKTNQQQGIVTPDTHRSMSLNSKTDNSSESDLQLDETITLTKLLKTFKTNLSTTVSGSSDNIEIKHQLNKVYWMPDSICHKCFFCEDEFTAIRRRHHCRMCGQVFCYRCCAFELPGSLWNQNKPQRSCHRCFQSFYSTSGQRKISNVSLINLNTQDPVPSSQDIRSSNSPTFSMRSENISTVDLNQNSQNKNLSFSSSDLSRNSQYSFPDHQPRQLNESSISDTLKRNYSVPEFEVTNCEMADIKSEHKISPGKLNPKYFIKNHFMNKDKSFLRTITSTKTSSTVLQPQYNQKVQKEILLFVWKEIIEETERLRNNYFNKVKVQIQTRSMENQFSFPNDDESNEIDGLDVIFTNATTSKSCINGLSLVNWIFNKIEEVKEKAHAIAICQSYLDMQLISPYFVQERCKVFKDDSTMYVIRECTSDYSPRSINKNYDSNHFTDCELMGYLTGSNMFQKNCGNSTFYADDDSISCDSKDDDADKSVSEFQYPSTFFNIHADDGLDSSTEKFYNKSSVNLWNKSCEYLEKLLKQELRDYNLDISWCNIILPICKMISETVSPNISDVKWSNDIRNYIQIKKISDSVVRDCQIIYSVSMSKNVDFSVTKDIKNPSIILIKTSIDYWRHKNLVSFEPLILQEEEYLKNCVRKIMNLKPDIVIVEGNVSLLAKELMEINGLILVSNVRKVQMERLARMFGTIIYDSVDSLGANVEAQLGRCSQFSVERFKLSNGRHKYLLFFKLFNRKDGCSLLLHSKSLSELVRLKYIIQFMIVAFRNAYLELACMKNFQIRFLGYKSCLLPSITSNDNPQSDSSSAFLDIVESRIIALSSNVHYFPPTSVIRKVTNPELQSRLLSLDVHNITWKEKLHNVLRRKQRHICGEKYSELRMKTRKHPLMHQPDIHSFLNCFHDRDLNDNEQCILYSDFRNNGGRFRKMFNGVDTKLISTLNFDSSDLVVNGGFLTKEQETRFRDLEKRKFESIWESFNPRNYRRILLLYSIQTPTGICEKPKKISLGYYENSDKTLGNFVRSILNDTSTCPIKCESSLFGHVYKFVHNGGCIEVSVHSLESDSHRKLLNSIYAPDNTGASAIKVWNWCSRCDKTLGIRDMSDATWNLSLGRFFDLLCNMNLIDLNLLPGQCSHSLQNDIHYYFTQSNTNRALEIKYLPVTVYEFQTPDLLININPTNRSNEDLLKKFKVLQKEIEKVTEIKTTYNLDIKDRILKLKTDSKIDDSELWDVLKQDSNTPQYSETMESIYNLMEQIYNSTTNYFNVELYKKHERYVNEEIIHLWIDVVNFVTKWDQKLSEAFEREEKDKKPSKVDNKNKSSNEDLLSEADTAKNSNTHLSTLNSGLPDNKGSHFNKTMSCVNESLSQDSVDLKKKFLWSSLGDKNIPSVAQQLPEYVNESNYLNGAGLDENSENIEETDSYVIKKEKNITARESDPKQISHGERSTGSTASILTKKFFQSFFNNNNLKILDEPTSADCSYVFPDMWFMNEPAVVKDDSITSVIAFALGSNVYHDKLNEMIQSTNFKPNTKSESGFTLYPPQETKLSSDIGQIDGFNNPNTFTNEGSGLYKDKSVSIITDPLMKDREMCVRYLNRPESEDPNDIVEMQSYECKLDNEEIKIEISAEEVFSEDVFQRPQVNSKVPITSTKKVPKCDLEMNFNNHKAKCFCRIYNALQFHKLREVVLGSDQQGYIRSLNNCKHWVTTGGKSGLKFRKTMDDRFIIKQLHPMELNGFRKFHEKYFEYIMERVTKKEKCVLAKILGIYHVDYSNSVTKVNEKLDFLIMENLFYNQKPSKIFDLKGNKQIAVNVSTEKNISCDTSVMQDKDFINYTRSKPIYVSWQTQIALKETLTRDTDFLRGLPVMDYSLLVGVDDDNDVLVIGLIDYLRMFTIDKLIEMHFKQKLLTPHGELPTVIQPQRYQKRFLEAMEEYFLICPIPWDCLLLSPAISNINNNTSGINDKNKYNNEENKTSTIKIPQKSPKIKSKLEENIDENKLRCRLFETI